MPVIRLSRYGLNISVPFYFRGLAHAVLTVSNKEDWEKYISQTIESYQHGANLCHEPGIIRKQQLLLDEFKAT